MKNSIKVERARLDMTQQDLADKLAVSRQTINAIEKGKFNPSTVLALKILDIHIGDYVYVEKGEITQYGLC